jgi:phosphate transport system permease protein
MAEQTAGRIGASTARRQGNLFADHFMRAFIYLNASLVVLSVILIFFFLIRESIPFFRERSLQSLLQGPVWSPLEPHNIFGALPLIGGTLLTTAIAIAIALPLGVLCAVFMGEIASSRLKTLLKSGVEILAGIPSVVIGFIGLAVVGPALQQTLNLGTGLTAFTGGLLLAFMALPTIISISEDALHAVPQDYRQASLALGATKLQTTWKAVVPAARRGIIAALMLGIGRAIGETMTVLMATGNAANVPGKLLAPIADNSLFQSIRTLTATIAAEMGETPVNSLHYHALFALGAILFVITFLVNTTADYALNSGNRRSAPPKWLQPLFARIGALKEALFESLWKRIPSRTRRQPVDERAPGRAAQAAGRRASFKGSLLRLWEGAQYSILTLSILSVLLPIAAIAWFVFTKGGPALSWDFIVKPPEQQMTAGGLQPIIIGTLYLLAGTFIFALPLGLFGAVYITEYGRGSHFTRILRLAIVNLAGVPSVVYGLFGLGFFVLFIGGTIDQVFFRQTLPKPTYGTGALIWAALTLTLLILPVVITAAEEALLSVPDSFREASLALGCTRWQTVRNVVLPSALPGIMTGMILGLSRAAGETAPILLTGASFFLPSLPDSIHSPFMALPYHLFITATQSAVMPERIPWGTALVLLLLVLGLNAVASLFRARARARRRW